MSHKTFAAPKLLFKDGDDLLSGTEDVVVDSGSTMTLTSGPLNCRECKPVKTRIQLAKKGETMQAEYKCIKTYYFRDRSGTLQKVELPAYIVPELQTDLIGCKNLTKEGYRIILDDDSRVSGIYPKGPDGEIDISLSFEFRDDEESGLYTIETFKSADAFQLGKGYNMWHHRLSHTEMEAIKKSIPFTTGLEHLKKCEIDSRPCPDCMIGKAQRNNRPGPIMKHFKPMAQVHWDVLTASFTSIEGYKYALLLVDKSTRFMWLHGLKTKDELLKEVRKWWADTGPIRVRHPLLCMMRDNAGEGKSAEVDDFFEPKGVAARYSTPIEQFQNGPSETGFRTLGRLTRSEVINVGNRKETWFSAMMKCVEAHNATWIRATGTTPYYALMNEKQDVSKIRRFECEAYVYLDKERRPPGKFEQRAVRGVNLGPATHLNTSAYRIWVPEENKLYVTNQVKFNENVLPLKAASFKPQPRGTAEESLFEMKPEVTFMQYDSQMVRDSLLDDLVIYKKGDERVFRLKDHVETYVKVNVNQLKRDLIKARNKYNLDWVVTMPYEEKAYQSSGIGDAEVTFQPGGLAKAKGRGTQAGPPKGRGPQAGPLHRIKGLPIGIDPTKPPKNYADAMTRPDAAEWSDAYDKEYEGFKREGAFTPVFPEPGEKVLATLTRLEYKTEADAFKKRKVRMCVRGDQQVEGVHYEKDDLYAPTIKPTEVRLLAAIAAGRGLPIYKTDTAQAFLYGDMDNDRILIRPPDWWPEQLKPGQVLKANRSVYGTKQAPRCWHTKVSNWMEQNGYPAVNDEKTIFMRKESGGDFIIHGLFVDDMKHIPTKPRLMKEFLAKYNKEFKTTGGMEKAMDMFVGVEYDQTGSGIEIHQDSYIRKLLEDYQASTPTPVYPKRIPIKRALHDEEPEASTARQKSYRSWVHRLAYAGTWTRLDITYPVGQLARYCGRAGPSHWEALHYLMGYLSNRPSLHLRYRRGDPGEDPLGGYVDADWGNHGSRSMTGMLALFNGTPIAWKSKLQPSVALSTSEVEYMAASVGAKEMIYLRRLMSNLGMPMRNATPVGEDNTGCIEWSNYVIGGRERAKHIDLRKHFAHEAVQNGEIILYKVPTRDQLADILTKGLSKMPFDHCMAGLFGAPEAARGTTSRPAPKAATGMTLRCSRLKRGPWNGRLRATKQRGWSQLGP